LVRQYGEESGIVNREGGADADAEEPLDGGADRARAEAGGDKNAGNQGVPGDWGERSDLLPVEEAVRVSRHQRDSPVKQLEEENRKLKHLVADLRSTS